MHGLFQNQTCPALFQTLDGNKHAQCFFKHCYQLPYLFKSSVLMSKASAFVIPPFSKDSLILPVANDCHIVRALLGSPFHNQMLASSSILSLQVGPLRPLCICLINWEPLLPATTSAFSKTCGSSLALSRVFARRLFQISLGLCPLPWPLPLLLAFPNHAPLLMKPWPWPLHRH